MSLDPKYANLPWIAHGQPDVYESGDLPEADQAKLSKDLSKPDYVHPEVEVCNLNPEEAQKVFAGSVIDGTNVDFNSVISRKGYYLERSSYDILPDSERDKENLLQKFQRLQTEVRQLADESSKLSDQIKADPDQPMNAAQLSQLIEALKSQLGEIQLESMLGPNADVDLNSPESLLLKHLQEQVNEFKPSVERRAGDGKKEASKIVYELYHCAEKEKEKELERAADLDRRLQRLEGLIGNPEPGRLSALTSETAGHSLLEAATRLAARSSLLRSDNLDQVESRLLSLQGKLQTITERREAISDADTQRKVAELYELVKKWHSVSETLPLIVERLNSLSEIHEQAADFSNALISLEKSQKDIDLNLQSYRDVLNHVEKNFKDSMSTVQENISQLEARLKK